MFLANGLGVVAFGVLGEFSCANPFWFLGSEYGILPRGTPERKMFVAYRKTQIVTLSALLTLWALNSFGAVPKADELSEVRDPATRSAAVAKLVAAGAPVAAIVVPLLTDNDVDVRLSALLVLRSVKAREMTPQVMSALSSDTSELVRAQAAETLGSFGDAGGVSALARAVSDSSRVVRVRAIAALGRINSSEAGEVIRHVIQEPDGEPEFETALVAAGRQRMVDQAARFADIVGDTGRPPSARGAAVIALGLMRAPNTSPTIIAALRDPSSDVRLNALVAIDELGSAGATAAVRAVLIDPDQENYVRLRAAWTLADLDRAGAKLTLASLAGGANEFMAMHAVVILASIDPDEGRRLAGALRAKTKDAFAQSTMDRIIHGEPLPWGRR